MMDELTGQGRRKAPERWSRTLSHILSPAGIAVLVLVCLTVTGKLGLAGMLTGAAFYVLVPAIVLLGMARRSGSADVYDPSPRIRQWMLLSGTICYLLGYVVVVNFHLHPDLRWAGATFAAGATAVLVIDRVWKVSIHNTGAGGGLVLLAGFAPDLWPLWCMLPVVVGWARWHQRAHDLGQLVGGSILGASLAWLLRGLFQ